MMFFCKRNLTEKEKLERTFNSSPMARQEGDFTLKTF